MKRRTFLCVGIWFMLSLPVASVAQSTDPLVPTSRVEDARVGPLAMVTIISDNPVATKRFYQGAMDMAAKDYELRGQSALAMANQLGLTPRSRLLFSMFTRPGLPQATKVRVVYVDSGTDQARPNHNSEYLGPLSLGFPVRAIEARAAMLSAFGNPATAGVTTLNLSRSDGSPYAVKEAHFKGPDGVLSLAIDRGDMQAVGAIDPAFDIGGPAYSGMIVSDTKAMDGFLADVMGFEKRRDVELASSGPNGGLGLPSGTRFQFQQWFAPGSATGYFVVMRYLNAGKIRPITLVGRSRGIIRYSFHTNRLNEVVSSARRANYAMAFTSRKAYPEDIKARSAVVLKGPDGIEFEFLQGQ